MTKFHVLAIAAIWGPLSAAIAVSSTYSQNVEVVWALAGIFVVPCATYSTIKVLQK